jgi:intraflagellar transport protein 81
MLQAMEEAQRGVSGFRVAEERMEQVSGEKANIDQKKGQTLEEMSSLILELSQRIATKKAQLAPIIKGNYYELTFIKRILRGL